MTILSLRLRGGLDRHRVPVHSVRGVEGHHKVLCELHAGKHNFRREVHFLETQVAILQSQAKSVRDAVQEEST